MTYHAQTQESVNVERLPAAIKSAFRDLYRHADGSTAHLEANRIYLGDARELLPLIEPNSVALSVWSPPYFVGKGYEAALSFGDWQALLSGVIKLHFPVVRPGGFLVINIADILCFRDESMPRVQAEAVSRRVCRITRQDVLRARAEHPALDKYGLARLLGCSEQTVDRRLNGNNIRGGKYAVQTRVKIVGGLVEQWALEAGFFPYDRRIWAKDPAWENSRWASLSYRAVDEFEYLYFFWKPGVTRFDRSRLSREEWRDWGSRGVWSFPSVRSNDDHEAKYPVELPRRVIRLLTDTGDVVLDCFVGSGTTAVAAVEQRRQYIGIEIEEKYVLLARQHLAATGQTMMWE